MLNRGKFFRTAMASPRFKGCATSGISPGATPSMDILLGQIAQQVRIAIDEPAPGRKC